MDLRQNPGGVGFLAVFNQYQPLWNSLDAKTSRKVRLENYKRIFDEGRRKVRSWESAHVPAVKSKNTETRISSN
jgi:hypothetical protein